MAPNCRASASFCGSTSMAMMRLARFTRRAWRALRPTPPQPYTTAVWPTSTLERYITAPTPVITPQPTRQAEVNGTSFGMATPWHGLHHACAR